MLNTIFFELLIIALTIFPSTEDKVQKIEMLQNNKKFVLFEKTVNGNKINIAITYKGKKDKIEIIKSQKNKYIVKMSENNTFTVDMENYLKQIKLEKFKKEPIFIKDRNDSSLYIIPTKDKIFITSPDNKMIFIVNKN